MPLPRLRKGRRPHDPAPDDGGAMAPTGPLPTHTAEDGTIIPAALVVPPSPAMPPRVRLRHVAAGPDMIRALEAVLDSAPALPADAPDGADRVALDLVDEVAPTPPPAASPPQNLSPADAKAAVAQLTPVATRAPVVTPAPPPISKRKGAAAPSAIGELHPAADETGLPHLVERATPVVLWICLALVLSSVAYGVGVGGVDLTVTMIFFAGIFLFATLLLVASLTHAYSPLLLAGVLLRRPRLRRPPATSLAGRDMLSVLGLAEGILSADVDARLVTTRDGVVEYANDQYMALARAAGVVGSVGLPPRLDRLFGDAAGESSKLLRLARAGRSGQAAEEIIVQIMGPGVGGAPAPRRRFEVAVRPMPAPSTLVAWRLRELAPEDTRDTLRLAYQTYPRPVIALERSGAIAWFNASAATLLDLRPGMSVTLADLVLGEAREIVDALWEDAPEEVESRIRQRGAENGNAQIVLTAFMRGGVGQGFVCVEMAPKAALSGEAANDPATDLTEAPFGVALIAGDPGAEARIASVNRMFADAFGARVDMKLADILSADAVRDLGAAVRTKSQVRALTRPVDVTLGTGSDARNFRVFARPIRRRRGAYGPRQTVLYALDVSFQKRMEEEAAHDGRLMTIGKIAGSVAHDFNNFIQAILGATELLTRNHPAGDPSYPDLVLIRENANRSRNLTQNLLAFAKKQTLQQEALSVTEFLSEYSAFVRRYVTEKVKVEFEHGRNVPMVKVDKGQLELAIMNLAVNARDAMEKGGTLTIATSLVPADEVAAFGYAALDPVDHALIELADTGTGVPEAIADRIFEPFFTTKGEGKGTGLGLSTVHGIIGQMGGRIFLHNRPGEGATFRIFLPALPAEEVEAALAARSAAAAAREAERARPVEDCTGRGRVLIVEDEDGVRHVVMRALTNCGYEIVEATNGEEALDIIESAAEPFDVVLSDIMMPEMDGPTLIEAAGDRLAGTKVIFMSGYAESAMHDKLSKISGARYLQKPFTLKTVAATVKQVMSGTN